MSNIEGKPKEQPTYKKELSKNEENRLSAFLKKNKRFHDADDTETPHDAMFSNDKAVENLLTQKNHEKLKDEVQDLENQLEDLQQKSLLANNSNFENLEYDKEIIKIKLERLRRGIEQAESKNPDLQKSNPTLETFKERLDSQNTELN